MSNPYYCGYDDKGNLYVDGTQTGLSTEFILAELPKGKPFKDITLKGGTINFPGNIWWDGKYVAVGDQDYQYYPEVSAIYQTTGGAGKIVGKPTVFASYGDISGFSIYGKTVIGPDWCINGCTGGSSVGFYNYPAINKDLHRAGEPIARKLNLRLFIVTDFKCKPHNGSVRNVSNMQSSDRTLRLD